MMLGIHTPFASANTDSNNAGNSAAEDATGAPTPFAAGPADPSVLYLEDFENVTGSTPTLLTNYNHAGTGVGYSADRYWSDPKFCNGFITRSSIALDNTQIFNTYCGQNGDSVGGGQGDYMAVRAKAYALGLLSGSENPAGNHALSTNTSGGTPSRLMFQTSTNNIRLEPDGDVSTRFIAFSVDAADTTGGNQIASPQMYFHLLQDGAAPRQMNSTALPGGAGQRFDLAGTFPNFPSWARAGLMGTYYSDPFTIDSVTEVGLRLENLSTASSEGCGAYRQMRNGLATGLCDPGTNGRVNGNDGAIDNIRIVDVTPVLHKEFSPAVQSIHRTSTMTLTINNRSDLGAKEGWEFTDTLPEGLEFADSTVTSTCGTTDATVDIGQRTLTVRNGVLAKGQEYCTIETTVISTGAGEYTNGDPNNNFSDKKYIDGPDDAKIEFYSGSVSWSKVDAATDQLLPGSEWTLTGPEPATDTEPEGGWPVGEVTDCTGDCSQTPDENPATGEFRVSGLPSGTYTLTETRAPEGYESAGPWTVEITKDDRDPSFGDGGRIPNTAIPTASVMIGKQLLDVDGAEIGPGEGWTVEAGLSDASSDAGTEIAPAGAQQTGATGSAPDPWEITFPSTTATAEVTVREEAQAGYEFASASCVITPESGDERTVSLTGTEGVLGGEDAVRPGDEVECTFVNQRLPGAVSWQKTDDAGETLAGSEWVLVGPAPSASEYAVVDCTGEGRPSQEACAVDLDQRPGFFEVSGLHWGSYELVETRAPAGHYPVGDLDPFTIDGEHLSLDLGAIENPRIDGPEIPLTGGIGRDAGAPRR